MQTFIISAADAVYFPLLKGLILSIHQHRPDDRMKICVMDVGLSPAQLHELNSLGAAVVTCKWEFEFADQHKGPPRWLQAQTARCRIPQYFPGADIYLWLDADVWLQDWRTIEYLTFAASRGLVGIVPEIHRSYRHIYRLAVLNDDRMYEHYCAIFGEEIGRELAMRPLYNSGVFAAPRDCPLWQHWVKWMQLASQRRIHKLSEQSSLNAVIYRDQVAIYPLPARCNWVCGQALPFYDLQNARFVEPVIPFEPISILHPTPRDTAVSDIKTTDGKTVRIPLDYLAFQAARDSLQPVPM